MVYEEKSHEVFHQRSGTAAGKWPCLIAKSKSNRGRMCPCVKTLWWYTLNANRWRRRYVQRLHPGNQTSSETKTPESFKVEIPFNSWNGFSLGRLFGPGSRAFVLLSAVRSVCERTEIDWYTWAACARTEAWSTTVSSVACICRRLVPAW